MIERTAAGRAEITKLAAGADMRDVDHLPVIELRERKVVSVPCSEPLDVRPPLAPTVVVPIEVSIPLYGLFTRRAARLGVYREELFERTLLCMLDALEAQVVPDLELTTDTRSIAPTA